LQNMSCSFIFDEFNKQMKFKQSFCQIIKYFKEYSANVAVKVAILGTWRTTFHHILTLPI
jgi:hypothetical protein